MSLVSFAKRYATDKHTRHTYVQNFYDAEFTPRKTSTASVLEIGVYRGASIALWRDFFENAAVTGLDTNPISVPNTIMVQADAYCAASMKFLAPFYDIMIDDGPHTRASQEFFIKRYLPRLSVGGIAVIEDIPTLETAEALKQLVPDKFVSAIVDLRKIDGCLDSILLAIKWT